MKQIIRLAESDIHKIVKETVKKVLNEKSYRITSKQGEQILATKTQKKDGNIQFEITKEYLLDFIKRK